MSTVTMESSRGKETRVTILAVGLHEEDYGVLRDEVSCSGWIPVAVGTIAEAVRVLARDPVPVILCENELPDGSWTDLLAVGPTGKLSTNVIVISRLADEHLWAEVLNLGGYDVLSTPLDGGELFRTLRSALRNWKAEGSEAASRIMLLGVS